MIAFADGRWVDARRATVPLADLGFLRGRAVFESVRVLGGGLFRLQQHLRRLGGGAAALRIAMPEPGRIADTARELVRRAAVDDAVLRITLTAGPEGSGHAGLYVSAVAMPPDWRSRAAAGWHLITARTPMPAPAAAPPAIKVPGRLAGMLAHFEAEDAGVDDALLLTTDGLVAEGPSWNVFWRRGRRLFTAAPAVGILEGVTRAAVLELARGLDYEVEEGRYRRPDLDSAEEIFVTMTSLGVVPVRRLDDRPLPLVAGDAAARLGERYWDVVARESEAP